MTIVPCPVCHQPHRVDRVEQAIGKACARCGTILFTPPSKTLARTAAFALGALLLYLPANILPVIRIEQDGLTSDSTVFGSVRLLWDGGDYFVAIVVFVASVVIPLFKLVALAWLIGSVWLGVTFGRRVRMALHGLIDTIGRWAMLDVFVLAVLVSVVKLRALATVSAGSGAFPFTLLVILTTAASVSFDPRLIWMNRPTHRRAIT